MFSKLVIVLLSVSLIQCASIANKGIVQTSDCGSKTGSLESLDIDGCTAAPCPLIKGKDATWTLKFKSSVNTSKLTSKVYGVIFGLPIPFSLPDPNSCNLGASCPVAAGDVNQVSITLPILSIYPSMSLNVKWEVLDENNKAVVCLTIPVKITS